MYSSSQPHSINRHDSLLDNTTYSMFVSNFKIQGSLVPEKFMMEKSLHKQKTYTNTATNVVMEKTKLYTPIYTTTPLKHYCWGP